MLTALVVGATHTNSTRQRGFHPTDPRADASGWYPRGIPAQEGQRLSLDPVTSLQSHRSYAFILGRQPSLIYTSRKPTNNKGLRQETGCKISHVMSTCYDVQ
jgi:hypothetical protein